VQHISDLHSKFALRPDHEQITTVDIQSPTAENRQGKKEERRRKKKETTAAKYNSLPITVGGHNK